MPSARSVANFFLEEGLQDNIEIDQLKIQKLVYYAYAWYAANYDGASLFPEEIEAWRHGPVVRTVWEAFRRFKDKPITEPATKIDMIGDGLQYTVPQVEESYRSFLRSVWQTYKEYTGTQLSNLTHSSDEPWSVIRARASSYYDNPIIPFAMIREFFSRKIARSRKVTV